LNTVSAVENVARYHGRALRALASRLTHDPNDASDLLQDAFERAIRCSRGQGPDELRRWMATVMRNLFIDQRRRKQANRRALVTMPAVGAATAEEHEVTPTWACFTSENVASAVETLDPPFREVFELHAKGASLSQVATELGIPASTAGTRLFRARRKLRAILLQSV
jgi:RNA polymerase sigma-70 factor (ECF subfamily)